MLHGVGRIAVGLRPAVVDVSARQIDRGAERFAAIQTLLELHDGDAFGLVRRVGIIRLPAERIEVAYPLARAAAGEEHKQRRQGSRSDAMNQSHASLSSSPFGAAAGAFCSI